MWTAPPSIRTMSLVRILPLLSAIGLAAGASAQCQITANATETTITCGECVTLSAFGNGTGNVAFTEDFNSGAPTGWQFTQSAQWNNPCSPGGVDGTFHMWMGDASPNPRDLITVPLDLSLGGSICFDMLFAEQGDASPCEGPDEPQEGVYLQYSTDNGATWQTIHYFDPNGGYDPQLTNWNNWCFPLPLAAATANTMIRWHQDDVTDNEYDHWGIDNVTIILNDPNFAISWLHDGYNYGLGAPGGNNPTPVCPMTTTTYTAQVSDGTTTCAEQVTIVVEDPVIILDAGTDTTICAGQCVTIDAEAYHLVSPASTPTFENNEFALVVSGNSEININVQGLNTTALVDGSITQVCINGFSFSGSFFCTTFGGCDCNGTPIGFLETCDLTPAGFTVTLTAPGGCEIVLVPAGPATGNYNNTCFVPVGGAPFGGGFPNGGTWDPEESLSGLNGCDANGVWTLSFSAPGLGLGIGTLFGWNISFDDPEITAPVNFVWDPTTDLTGSNTLAPEACPSATTTYTLSATDQAGCITVTDDVTITIQNCCALEVDAVAVVDAACGAADGSITVTSYTGEITGLVFSLDGGPPQASPTFSGLAAGTYTVTVNDDNNCPVDQQVVVNETGGPEILGIIYYPPTCAGGDGSLVITTAGGTQFSIDNGNTFQADNAFIDLNGGSYPVVVTDANGCATDTIADLPLAPDAPVIGSVDIVQPTCGATDGSINVVSPTPNVTYSIDGGLTYQAAPYFGGLGAGTYPIVVQTDAGCTTSSTADLNPSDGPVLDDVSSTPAVCGAPVGSITITATGAGLTYSIDGGGSFVAGNTFTDLPAGTYDIVVEDGAGCSTTTTIDVPGTDPPMIDPPVTVPPSCGLANGSITLSATGTGPFTYSIDGGATFQPGNVFTDLPPGTYPIVVSNGCEATEEVIFLPMDPPEVVSIVVDPPACTGDATGAITIDALGAAPLVYSIDGGTTFQAANSFAGLAAGDYDVVVEDVNGCAVAITPATTIVDPAPVDFDLAFVIDPPSCLASDGTLTITGSPEIVDHSMDGGATFQASPVFNGISAGSYTIVVMTANGCTTDSIIDITAPDAPEIVSVTIIDPACGTANGELTIESDPPGLQYSIDGGTTFQAANNFPGLAAGTYTIVVLAPDACTDQTTADLVAEAGPGITNITPAWPSCNGLADGSITIGAEGLEPLQYSVDDGITFQAGPAFTGLAAGTYDVVVQDVNGCTSTQTTVLGDHPALDLALVVVQPGCNDPCSGSITAAANGGYGAYVHTWSNGSASPVITGLCAGPYDLTVMDANGCTAFASALLFEPNPPVVDSLTIVPESCVGACDGTVTVHATGASAFVIGGQPPQLTGQFAGLCPGDVTISVLGAEDCVTTTTATIGPGSTVLAAFTADPWSTSTLYTQIAFTDASVNATSHLWDFGGHGTATTPNASFVFPPEAATHVVCLEVANAAGCADEICQMIVITPDGTIHVPNTFTPDDDGINDTFFAVADPAIEFLDMDIFDRWGERIFTSTSLADQWDGSYNGTACQDGVYVWRIRAKDPVTAEIRDLIGHVNLLR